MLQAVAGVAGQFDGPLQGGPGDVAELAHEEVLEVRGEGIQCCRMGVQETLGWVLTHAG